MKAKIPLDLEVEVEINDDIMRIIKHITYKYRASISDIDDLYGHLLMTYVETYRKWNNNSIKEKRNDPIAYCIWRCQMEAKGYTRNEKHISTSRGTFNPFIPQTIEQLSLDRLDKDNILIDLNLNFENNIQKEIALRDAVKMLSPRDQYVFAKTMEGYNQKEIAYILRISESMVNLILKEMKIKLRSIMEWKKSISDIAPIPKPYITYSKKENFGFIPPEEEAA